MSDISTIRDHLLNELNHGVRTAKGLVSRITPDQWSYRPKENMRTLQELTIHLVMVQATDLAILQEKQGPEFDAIEGDVKNVTDPEQLCELMQRSLEAMKDYMTALSESDFLNKSTKPFYSDQGAVQVKWLIEVVTHLFHYRAQLFSYLKELGHEVNMFDLY